MSVQSVMRGTGIGCDVGLQQATAARTRRPESDAMADDGKVSATFEDNDGHHQGWGDLDPPYATYPTDPPKPPTP